MTPCGMEERNNMLKVKSNGFRVTDENELWRNVKCEGMKLVECTQKTKKVSFLNIVEHLSGFLVICVRLNIEFAQYLH